MSKLITKARAGVTLVELLVVILIVTILSVSMLPLLQPFVTEAQYAAEAIPVIGNIRTKVGLYQYDKSVLPCIGTTKVTVQPTQQGGQAQQVDTPQIETWIATTADNGTAQGDASKVDYFNIAKATFPSTVPPLTGVTGLAVSSADAKNHFGTLCDIDYQDLKGKRSKPHHYQYVVMMNGAEYAYFVGCFGDDNGLKKGTGYAVCEILAKGHKYVGTWKRYKPVADAQTICFTSATEQTRQGSKQIGCYVPQNWNNVQVTQATGKLNIVTEMEGFGWEFQ